MKIGIMGPTDSIEKVLNISKDFLKDIEFIPLTAHTLQESRNLISNLNKEIDGLLFTGRSVYDSVKENIPRNLSFEFVPHNESSLFSLLMENPLKEVRNISIDVMENHIVEESLKHSKIKSFFLLSHKDGYSEENYMNFHEENLNSNKVDTIFTTFSPIYDYFKTKGIPVYRLYTTNFAIRNSLNRLINKIKSNIIDRSKIAVQLIKFHCNEEDLSKFELLNVLLKFQESLIPYLKTIQGSIFNNGWNEFILFSTKGAIDSTIAKNEFHKILKKEKYKIFSGIGLGVTAAEAELNASQALKYSKDYNESSFYFMYEDKSVEGPIGLSDCISVKNKITSKKIDSISNKTGLSHAYIDKINSIMSLYNISEFSSEEIAEYLGITSRSARRIIKKLIDGGCAKIVGKEGRGGSGRPQNIIKLLF